MGPIPIARSPANRKFKRPRSSTGQSGSVLNSRLGVRVLPGSHVRRGTLAQSQTDYLFVFVFLPLFNLLLLMGVLLASPTYAKDRDEGGASVHGKGSAEIKVESSHDDDEDGFEAEDAVGGIGATKVEIKSNSFEITGTITAISANTFTVAGQTITIDPSKVNEFEQKGILSIGNRVKVEGAVISGTNFAREITVLGTGQGKLKVEVKNQPGENKIEIKAIGPVATVNAFLTQILSFLKNLLL